MNNADDSTPTKYILPDDSDLGPEPDWLLDDVIDDEPVTAKTEPEVVDLPPPVSLPAQTQEFPEEKVSQYQSGSDSVDLGSQAAPSSSVDRPWMWGAVPLVLLIATGFIAWFGTTQTLNNIATWEAIRSQQPALLPARWAMTIWWAVVPLIAVFLIYGILPVGREVTRIKITGPSLSVALVATSLWIFAEHWLWEVISIISIGISAIALLITYLLVALGPKIKSIRQRLFAVLPLSAALGYSVMLTVLSWQSYSSQPFGERGSSILFTLLLVIAAAVFAFFLRDGLVPLVLAIWFAGVVHQQWGEDAVISIVAAVAVLITGALAGLGTILSTESHRPSLTTSMENRSTRTSFFRRSQNPPQQELP